MGVMSTKKLYIKTWGCQMNEYDSKRMADILTPLGYTPTQDANEADFVILNTCHIREKATEKVFSELGFLRDSKKAKATKGQKMMLAVAGCVAQAEGDYIAERAPYVDMVFGPQTYHLLPEMIVKATGERVVNTEFLTDSKFDVLPPESEAPTPSAYLSIQEGCDKFCSFCVVPYTRGAEYSRPVAQIVNEAKRLVDGGTKCITLLGQNVNAWHGDKGENFGDLLYILAEIEGLEQLRYMTSHPRDMHARLYEAHRDLDKVMPFLHLPVQSGSDAVLDKMNRKHTRDEYFDIIDTLRKARPDIAFSSDFIIGFPGESDKDFEDTMDMVRRVGFMAGYSYKYSARPGTPAANMQNLVREQIKTERLHILQKTLQDQATMFNSACVGKVMTVLFDGKGNREGQLFGRTQYNQPIHVMAPARLFGQITQVTVTAANASALTGEIVTDERVLAGAA